MAVHGGCVCDVGVCMMCVCWCVGMYGYVCDGCVCVWVYVCVWVWMCVCMCVCMCVSMDMCVAVCV